MKTGKIAVCLALLILFTFTSGIHADDDKKLNLNSATVEQLAKVPGLSVDLAKKIVELREENGEFVDMEELLEIDGVDMPLLRKLKKSLEIEELDDCNC